MYDSHELFEAYNDDYPNQFKWFTEQKINVLDIEGGRKFCIVLVENEFGKKEFYGLGKKMLEK